MKRLINFMTVRWTQNYVYYRIIMSHSREYIIKFTCVCSIVSCGLMEHPQIKIKRWSLVPHRQCSQCSHSHHDYNFVIQALIISLGHLFALLHCCHLLSQSIQGRRHVYQLFYCLLSLAVCSHIPLHPVHSGPAPCLSTLLLSPFTALTCLITPSIRVNACYCFQLN